MLQLQGRNFQKRVMIKSMLSFTVGSPFTIAATALLVVPKSMPTDQPAEKRLAEEGGGAAGAL